MHRNCIIYAQKCLIPRSLVWLKFNNFFMKLPFLCMNFFIKYVQSLHSIILSGPEFNAKIPLNRTLKIKKRNIHSNSLYRQEEFVRLLWVVRLRCHQPLVVLGLCFIEPGLGPVYVDPAGDVLEQPGRIYHVLLQLADAFAQLGDETSPLSPSSALNSRPLRRCWWEISPELEIKK